MRFRTRRQAGDTIVEVIIAVAVVAMVLAGAFVVTNRSTEAVRDSEEHAEALQGLQGQVELLRAAAGTKGQLTTANLSQPFCFGPHDGLHTLPYASCAGTGGAVPYQFSISCTVATACPTPIGATTNFSLTVSWPALDGNTDHVYLAYGVEVQ